MDKRLQEISRKASTYIYNFGSPYLTPGENLLVFNDSSQTKGDKYKILTYLEFLAVAEELSSNINSADPLPTKADFVAQSTPHMAAIDFNCHRKGRLDSVINGELPPQSLIEDYLEWLDSYDGRKAAGTFKRARRALQYYRDSWDGEDIRSKIVFNILLKKVKAHFVQRNPSRYSKRTLATGKHNRSNLEIA